MSSEKKCCVPGCSASSDSHAVLHLFPNPAKDAERFMSWLFNIGGEILEFSNEYIYKNRRVCHAHFELKYCCRYNRISNIAVPTLNMPGLPLHPFPNPSNTAQIERFRTWVMKIGIPGVHVGEQRHIELPSTSDQIKTASTRPVQMDIDTSSRPVMNIKMPCNLLQMETAVSTKPVQKDTDLTSNPGCYKSSMPLTAREKKLKGIISKVTAKLRKARDTNRKLRKQLMIAKKIIKSSANQIVKEKITPVGRRFILNEKVLCLSYKPSPS